MNDAATPIIWLILLVAYFVPSLVANYRQHHNTTAIIVLNLFLGWTFLGWIAALVWATTVRRTA